MNENSDAARFWVRLRRDWNNEESKAVFKLLLDIGGNDLNPLNVTPEQIKC